MADIQIVDLEENAFGILKASNCFTASISQNALAFTAVESFHVERKICEH